MATIVGREKYYYTLVAALLVVFVFYLANRYSIINGQFENQGNASSRVLLIYVYMETHEFAPDNIRQFIQNAVRDTDPVDYYFIIHKKYNPSMNASNLPVLPSNAQYIFYNENCFYHGTIGWFFSEYTVGNPYKKSTSPTSSEKINLRKYKYFVLMNSSIRGPYLPPYYFTMISFYESRLQKKIHWHSIFTERISSRVKLVGSLISCEISPHVQSHILATDFIGLSIAFKSGYESGVFACHQSDEQIIKESEIGFSARILAEGYMIDCLMRKYQRLDFSAPTNRNCSGNANPHLNNAIDGISLDPYEMVFVKFEYSEFHLEAFLRAITYDKWTEEVKNNNAVY